MAGEMMGVAERAAGPREIGGMAVVREIGRGGMGIVYEAWQKEPRRRVALKVIHPALLSPGALERFRREIRAMAALTHPGIVQLYGVGGGGGGDAPHLVMELVEGASLREWAATGRGAGPGGGPGVGERLRLLAEVCDAVHHAHQKGVVHRDLKPDNILVVREDGGTRPKVLDFGVSRLLEDEPGGPARTYAGQVVGTVPYLSPEQAEGDAGGTDTRSDVYALGVIAFELLAGEPPLDVRGLTTTAAIRRVLSTPHKRLRAVAPSLDADVQTVVHKAMHRDPSQRYSSAAELAADLRRAMANEPVLARAPSWGYVTRKFVRRHRVLAGVAGVSAVVIVASVVAMALAWADARRTREAAVWQRYLSAMSAASVALPTGDIATARRALESTPPEHRGWEFAHLSSRLDQSVSVVRSGMGSGCVAAEIEGLGLCVADAVSAGRVDAAGVMTPLDPRLRLWIAAHASVLPAPIAWTEGVVYWSRGDRVGVRETRLVHWPRWAVSTVHEARASADGRTIALRVSGEAHAVVVGRLPGGDGAVMEIDPAEPAARIDLSADGRRVAVAFDTDSPRGRVLRVFDAATGCEVSRTPPLARAPMSVALAPAGDVAVVSLNDGVLERWDLAAGLARRAGRLEEPMDAPRNLRLSPDGALLVGGSRDGLVRLWDGATLGPLGTRFGHETEVLGAGFDAGGARVVTTGTDGTVRLWDPSPQAARPLVLGGHTHLVHPIAVAGRGRLVYTGSWDRTVAAYRLDTGERVASVVLDDLVQHLALSPDERLLAVREYHRPARILDAATLGTVRTVDVDRSLDAAPMFDTASGRVVLGVSVAARTALVLDVASGGCSTLPLSELRSFVGPTINARAGLIGVTGFRQSGFCTLVLRLDDGHEVLARPSRRVAIESMAFSADGSRLAILGEGHEIDVFDTATMARVGVCRGHAREVLAMVFSPDGRRLFSADFTGVIRVWDTRTCDEVGQLRGHEAHIRRLAVSADGRCLVSGSRDGTARVWCIP